MDNINTRPDEPKHVPIKTCFEDAREDDVAPKAAEGDNTRDQGQRRAIPCRNNGQREKIEAAMSAACLQIVAEPSSVLEYMTHILCC